MRTYTCDLNPLFNSEGWELPLSEAKICIATNSSLVGWDSYLSVAKQCISTNTALAMRMQDSGPFLSGISPLNNLSNIEDDTSKEAPLISSDHGFELGLTAHCASDVWEISSNKTSVGEHGTPSILGEADPPSTRFTGNALGSTMTLLKKGLTNWINWVFWFLGRYEFAIKY